MGKEPEQCMSSKVHCPPPKEDFVPSGKAVIVSITFLITALLFTAGIFGFQYCSSFLEPRIKVSGVVRYHRADLTVSADPPEGYYVESSAIGRIYLQHNAMPGALTRSIDARGTLRGMCGNDKGACFPMIRVEWLQTR